MRLRIEHTNVYRYRQPVELTLHRLMLRPAESHEVTIQSERLDISPNHQLRWEHDVFYNSVALASFQEKTEELRITSCYTVQKLKLNPFEFVLEIYTNKLPFAYQGNEADDLRPYMQPQFPQDQSAISQWVKPHLDTKGRAETLPFLLEINSSVPRDFSYRRREEHGIQSPAETLMRKSGTCRDFALLLMETARYMGLAARYVSGYLCSSEEENKGVATNSTHAWTEIYLPGGGWRGFDPTSGILAAEYHVRVAATRDPSQATPISGSYIGDASLFQGMEVSVKFHQIESQTEQKS